MSELRERDLMCLHSIGPVHLFLSRSHSHSSARKGSQQADAQRSPLWGEGTGMILRSGRGCASHCRAWGCGWGVWEVGIAFPAGLATGWGPGKRSGAGRKGVQVKKAQEVGTQAKQYSKKQRRFKSGKKEPHSLCGLPNTSQSKPSSRIQVSFLSAVQPLGPVQAWFPAWGTRSMPGLLSSGPAPSVAVSPGALVIPPSS